MDVTPTDRACPQCGSSDYQFRSRKKVHDGGTPSPAPETGVLPDPFSLAPLVTTRTPKNSGFGGR